jgi:hypothetical protein
LTPVRNQVDIFKYIFQSIFPCVPVGHANSWLLPISQPFQKYQGKCSRSVQCLIETGQNKVEFWLDLIDFKISLFSTSW